jgi:hypothetical protein
MEQSVNGGGALLQLVRTSGLGQDHRVRDRATVSGQSLAVRVDYRFACESGRLVVADSSTVGDRPSE